MIPPDCGESQENRNKSTNTFNLAANHIPFSKAFYITFDWVFHHEIEYPLVECDHRLHRGFLNRLPKLGRGFRLNIFFEILPAKYLPDIFRKIGWKSIITIEDQFKGSFLISNFLQYESLFQNNINFYKKPVIIF